MSRLCLFVLSSTLAFSAAACSDNKGSPSGDGGTGVDGTLADGRQPRQDATLAQSDSYPLADGMDRLTYCAGNGPPIIVTDPAKGQTACTGALAQVAFRFALCTCEPFTSLGGLATDGFDSAQGSYDPQNASTGGAVGFNGAFSSTGPTSIGGPMQVGSGGASFTGGTPIFGNFVCNGNVSLLSELAIEADATVDGDISGVGNLRVKGTLTQSAGKTVSTTTQEVGATKEAALAIAPPCDCSPEHLIDIAKLVTIYKTANDNAAAKFDPNALSNFLSDSTLEVPCGRFYLTGLKGTGDLVLKLAGRSALFVAGDLDITGSIKVEFASPSAELDLFVEGGLNATGGLNFGDASAPSRVRIYAGTDKEIAFVGTTTFGGNLYAPKAKISTTGPTDAFGAIFARTMNATGKLTIHYDRSILEVGKDCPEPSTPSPGPQCSSCRDCANQACIDGSCGECKADSDCCAPLLCRQGRCLPQVL